MQSDNVKCSLISRDQKRMKTRNEKTINPACFIPPSCVTPQIALYFPPDFFSLWVEIFRSMQFGTDVDSSIFLYA